MKKRYSGITQKVLNMFISMCSPHQQQKSLTDHHKKPINHPIQANGFMNPTEIDWINFRSLACQCKKNTHTHMASSCFWPLYKVFVNDTPHTQMKSSSHYWIRETVLHTQYTFGFLKISYIQTMGKNSEPKTYRIFLKATK